MAKRRRGNGDGSVFYSQSKKKWIATLTVANLDGSTRRVSRIGHNRMHAKILLDELKVQFRKPTTAPSQMSVADLFDLWLKSEVKPNSAARTYETNQSTGRNHITPYIGKHAVQSLSSTVIAHWLTSLMEAKVGDRARQLSFTTLRNCLNYACSIHMIDVNPCSHLKTPRCRRKAIDPFSQAEVAKILKEASGSPFYPAYLLAFTAGLRQGELFGLQWEDVNWDAATLMIERQACETAAGVQVKEPKTGAGKRTITITPSCLAALKATPRECTWIFHTSAHTPIRRTNFARRQWRPLLERLGIRHRGFHHVRHTAATTMLARGVSPHVVAHMLGHSRPSTTLDLYAHFIPDLSHIASDAMSDIG